MILAGGTSVVAESNLPIIHGKDAIVSNGDAVDIAGKVQEDFLCSLNAGLAVYNLFDMPHGLREVDVGQRFAGQGNERCPEDPRQRPHGNKEPFRRHTPGGAVGRETKQQ